MGVLNENPQYIFSMFDRVLYLDPISIAVKSVYVVVSLSLESTYSVLPRLTYLNLNVLYVSVDMVLKVVDIDDK